jgi:hypothetical protein
MILVFTRTSPIITSGSLLDLILILANQLIWHFLPGPSNLHLGSGFGNLTTLQNEDFHILQFVLCGQADETIQHTLVACVFARQVWTTIFHVLGLLPFVPQPEDLVFLAGGAI